MSNTLGKEYVKNFLEKNILAIASTVDSDGLPHAAPVYFIFDKEFNFYFVTPEKTQKNENIKNQNEIILTITDVKKKETIQIRGKAHNDADMLDKIFEKLSVRLNQGQDFITKLPLFTFKKQQKTVVVIKPYDIRFRKFLDDKFIEETINID